MLDVISDFSRRNVGHQQIESLRVCADAVVAFGSAHLIASLCFGVSPVLKSTFEDEAFVLSGHSTRIFASRFARQTQTLADSLPHAFELQAARSAAGFMTVSDIVRLSNTFCDIATIGRAVRSSIAGDDGQATIPVLRAARDKADFLLLLLLSGRLLSERQAFVRAALFALQRTGVDDSARGSWITALLARCGWDVIGVHLTPILNTVARADMRVPASERMAARTIIAEALSNA